MKRLDPWLVLPALLGAILAVGYGLSIWSAGQAAGLSVPLGSDGPIWLGVAGLLQQGLPPSFPTMYPRLVLLFGLGEASVPAALRADAFSVSLGLLAAVALPAVALPERRTRAVAMLLAPLVVIVSGDPAAMAWAVHPEVLITAVLVLIGVAAVAFVRWPSWKTALALGAVAGIAVGTKEHGMVPAVLAPGLVIALRLPWKRRLQLLGWGGLAFVLLILPQLLDDSLTQRVMLAVRESLGWFGQEEQAFDVLPVEMSAEQQAAVREGETMGMFARQMVTASRDWWLPFLGAFATLGGLVATRRWRLAMALALPLTPPLPALLVWTEPRHYMVVAAAAGAVAVVGLGLLAARLEARGALGAGLVGLLAVGLAAPRASARLNATLAEQVDIQTRFADDFEALAWLEANAAPDQDFLRFDTDPYILGKAPFRPPPPGARPQDLGAEVWLVSSQTQDRAWEEHARFGELVVYRWR